MVTVLVLLTLAAAGFLLTTGGPFSGGGPESIQDVASTLNEPGTVGAMNKTLSILFAVFILIVIPVVVVAASYNNLVNREEAVLTSWAQVESQFQRRADLIPALVETVTRYLKHERETLSEVTARRRPDFDALNQVVSDLTRQQEAMVEALEGEHLIENQAGLDDVSNNDAAVGKTIAGLFLVAEDYPTLASSDQFLELQAQLEGTENRINVARLRFNEAVGAFNSASRRIPGNIAASLGGFRRKAYFKAEEGSEEAPESLFE